MKKLILLFGVTLLCMSSFSQPGRKATIKKTATAPLIDGVTGDACWSAAEKNNIDVYFKGEQTGFLEDGDFASYWKACWCDSGIFILVDVTADDVHYVGADNGWGFQVDLSEVYFDMNIANLKDGVGAGSGQGHYQFAGAATDTTLRYGQKSFKTTKVTNTLYTQELFISWSDLADKDEKVITDPAGKTVGFDVCMADNDDVDNNRVTDDGGTDPRSRMVWANDNSNGLGDGWGSLDDAGLITFSGDILAVSSASGNLKLSVFPNPTSDILSFSGSVNQVVICNILGKEVLKTNQFNIKSVNVSSLNKGVYFVTADNNTFKFIKQ